MGDIWPYGPPDYESYANCQSALEFFGMSSSEANIGAAIATAESSRDLSVINDTAATGDYSVGCWQINYYGSLYSSRAAEFGTPQQLIADGVLQQAKAAYILWQQSGDRWTPWSTYNSGAYLQYLSGGGASSGGGGGSNEPTISEGATGAAVTLLQQDLNLLGAGLSVDGDFGPLTLAAVENFQRGHSLAVDGVVGPLTWNALGLIVAAQGIAPAVGAVGTVAAPPNEAPIGLDGNTAQAWSDLAYQTGAYANSLISTLNSLSSTSPVG